MPNETRQPFTIPDLIDNSAPERTLSGEPPRVLDCFASGAISLEALCPGCETHVLDLNPVAVLILKAALEYPQRYSQASGVSETSEVHLLGMQAGENWVELTAQSREPIGPNVLDLKVRETLQQIGADTESFEVR